MAIAASICSTAGPVVPMGKNRLGSESRQAARSRQSVVMVVSTNFSLICDLFHKGACHISGRTRDFRSGMYWPGCHL
jgi:hypothetical protein